MSCPLNTSQLTVKLMTNCNFFRYRCNQGERHRVMLYLNEEPVEFRDCSVGLCNWDTFKNKLYYSTQCGYDICSGQGAIVPGKTAILTTIFTLSLIIFNKFF